MQFCVQLQPHCLKTHTLQLWETESRIRLRCVNRKTYSVSGFCVSLSVSCSVHLCIPPQSQKYQRDCVAPRNLNNSLCVSQYVALWLRHHFYRYRFAFFSFTYLRLCIIYMQSIILAFLSLHKYSHTILCRPF